MNTDFNTRQNNLPKIVSKIAVALPLISLIFISFFLSGCAINVKTAVQPAKKTVSYKSRKEVLAGLIKNYGTFGGLSGRLSFKVSDGGFSVEQAGIYKYIAGKYISFMILDMYGDVLFYAKIIKTKKGTEAVFLNPKDGKVKSINLDEKYKVQINNNDKTQNYKRLLRVLKILLFIDKLNKIKKAAVFYNTVKGFFFAYRGKCSYYICVSKKYLIRSVTSVKNGKKIESVRFKDYVLKGSGANKSMVPLKIYVDDYLYNVKMNIRLSKGSKLIY
ncbi:MAG: hypothetical protein ACP5NA_00620 [Candidatus Acidulodesulfobacterium sp.]